MWVGANEQFLIRLKAQKWLWNKQTFTNEHYKLKVRNPPRFIRNGNKKQKQQKQYVYKNRIQQHYSSLTRNTNQDKRLGVFCIFHPFVSILPLHWFSLFLPLIYFTQEWFQHCLHGFAWMSFNRGYQLLVALALIFLKYNL